MCRTNTLEHVKRYGIETSPNIAIKMPTKTRVGVVCLLEFKRMSDVTRHYIVRAKRVAEAQYASLRSTLVMTMQRQGWKVEQVSFISGARSLNEEELK